MDALAADFCPPKKTIVETIAAAPSRLARFCFSFSLSSEDDSDEDATVEKHVSFVLFLFDDDDALLLMKILLPVGFCSRLEDDDRIIHLSFFEEESKEEAPSNAVPAAAEVLKSIEKDVEEHRGVSLDSRARVEPERQAAGPSMDSPAKVAPPVVKADHNPSDLWGQHDTVVKSDFSKPDFLARSLPPTTNTNA